MLGKLGFGFGWQDCLFSFGTKEECSKEEGIAVGVCGCGFRHRKFHAVIVGKNFG